MLGNMLTDSDSDGDDLPSILPTFATKTSTAVFSPLKTRSQKVAEVECLDGKLQFSPMEMSSGALEEQYELKSKYRLDNLLKERHKKLKRLEIDQQCKEQLSKGGVLGIREDDSENESADLSPSHETELHEYSMNAHGKLPEVSPGEKVFQAPPKFGMPSAIDLPYGEPFPLQQADHSADEYIEDLLCGGWLQLYYLRHDIPRHVGQWLMEILVLHPRVEVATASFKTLCNLIHSANQAAQSSADSPCLLHLDDFLSLVCALGASHQSLCCDKLNTCTSSQLAEQASVGIVQSVATTASCDQISNRMKLLVDFLTICVQSRPLSYSSKEVSGFLFLLARCALDKSIRSSCMALTVCIAWLLNTFPEQHWKDNRSEICQLVCQVVTHHHNYVDLCDLMPATQRGRELQRVLSFHFMEQLSPSCDSSSDGSSTPTSVVLADMIRLLACWIAEKAEKRDMYRLYSFVFLLDMCASTILFDNACSNSTDLQVLVEELRRLDTSINPGSGQYVDRMQVRDVIFRLKTRFGLLAEASRSTQSKLSDFFNTGAIFSRRANQFGNDK